MSHATLPNYTRLSDALERELMLAAMAEEQTVSLGDVFKAVASAIRHGIAAVFQYAAALGEAVQEARAKDPHNSNHYGI